MKTLWYKNKNRSNKKKNIRKQKTGKVETNEKRALNSYFLERLRSSGLDSDMCRDNISFMLT